MTRLPILALALALAGPAAAQDQTALADGTAIRAEDAARLEGIETALGRAVLESARAEAGDLGRALAGLRGDPLPAEEVDAALIEGEWRCQMTKLGGIAGAISYDPFRCVVTAEGGTIGFEKLTGSQRTRGTIHRDADGLVYLGSSFVHGEAPLPYADFPETVDTSGTETLPDVGRVEIVSDERGRIIFPFPYRESTINILTLTR